MRKAFALSFRCALFAGGVLAAGVLAPGTASAQEVLLSDTENYYEFLALQGLAERPYLNYRTLSDSTWKITEGADHPWKDSLNNPVRELSDSVRFRIYGPELFTSYNSAAPYGQNDGVLWQGKGFNSSVTAGARLEAYGFELTLKPTVAFSQNLAFDLVAPAYPEKDSTGDYSGKAAEFGYFGVRSIDAPQRFGDDPFFDYSWGDSEIRYTWKSLTAGFGTQLVWLGPAKINPIIHSNNAPPYPKFDIGLRKTAVVLPKLGWYLGDFETRLWWGYLSESDWFDNDSGNDHNMISGLTVAYAPPVLDGLTLFANRTYLAKWGKDSWRTIPSLFFVNLGGGGAQDVWDQRASLGFSWLVPIGGIEVYGEAGLNDYGPSLDGYIRYPFHSMVYTAGLQKEFEVQLKAPVLGRLLFEWSNFEISQDFQFQWPSTFYAHDQIIQGYTNSGQWIGAGNGTGGNSQCIGLQFYVPKTEVSIFMQRTNPDNDFIYKESILKTPSMWTNSENPISDFKAVLKCGLYISRVFFDTMSIKIGYSFIKIHNPQYESIHWGQTDKQTNYNFEFSTSYFF